MTEYERIVSIVGISVWLMVALEFIAYLNWSRRRALAYLEAYIASTKPRPNLTKRLAAKPVPLPPGRWQYDHLGPKPLTQKPWFRP